MLYLYDVDGTLIRSYMERPDRDFHAVEILTGRQEMIAKQLHLGHDVALVSNQGGVAFGFVSAQDVVKKFGRVAMALGFASIWMHDGGTPIRAGWEFPALDCFVCYNDPRAKDRRYQDASRRKPSDAMLLEAIREYPVAAEDGVLMIGDRPEDDGAARAAGVRFAWADQFFGGH